ncbi:hypothetical protein [Nonomuraea turcica]|uniref:hypothetical protein n=1 Tax=Nonomuraea sp. G32 TaxID=3067274 RepID=UPI00273C3594|nr:hypothetical protein [Nonomuraea sp. G32]MDP4511864.1 hypothetical protein [Nonomuraea sp. G32]
MTRPGPPGAPLQQAAAMSRRRRLVEGHEQLDLFAEVEPAAPPFGLAPSIFPA